MSHCVTLTLRSIVPPGTLYCIKYLLGVAYISVKPRNSITAKNEFTKCTLYVYTHVQNLRVGSTI